MATPATDITTDTEGRDRRRAAVDNARAIVAFAGGSISSLMDALNERFVSGELTADEVVVERLRRQR